MTQRIRGILQLDFDGTLTGGDVSTGILARFASPAWLERVESASRELKVDPDSPALIETMTAGYAELKGNREDFLRFARTHHAARHGLVVVVEAALRAGFECHVVSNGFEFYIREYLREAGVEERLEVHCGSDSEDGLGYLGPEGLPLQSGFKVAWAEHFLAHHNLLAYVGDGTSDVAPAMLAHTVFARDGLLAGMPEDFPGTVYPFENLTDIANGLEALFSD